VRSEGAVHAGAQRRLLGLGKRGTSEQQGCDQDCGRAETKHGRAPLKEPIFQQNDANDKAFSPMVPH
jgi:hypothetical protein